MPRNIREKEELPVYHIYNLSDDKLVHIQEIRAHMHDFNLELFRPHYFGHFAITWVVNGEGDLYIDHIKYPIENNKVFLTTPRQIRKTIVSDETEFVLRTVAFHEELFPLMGYEKDIIALISGFESHWNVKLDEENLQVIDLYFKLLLKEFELGPEDRNPWILAALAKAYILHIVRIHNNNAQFRRKPLQYQNLYREYLDKLEEHYAETHYVADYVDMLHVNEKQLNRACKAMTGFSARHIIDERLNFEAKRFLYYSTHTIKEISYYLGFKDPAHFVKFFKRKNGKTPGEYKSHLVNIEPPPPKKKEDNQVPAESSGKTS